MTDEEKQNRAEAVTIYRLIFETWRFQVDSGWQRTNYFAAFETALLLGVGKIIFDGHRIFGIIASVLGILLTAIWITNDVKVQSYIDYWWAAIKEIEEKFFTANAISQPEADIPKWSFASGYDPNAKRYRIRFECPSYRLLMRMVPWLFIVAWLSLIGLALADAHFFAHGRFHHRWGR